MSIWYALRTKYRCEKAVEESLKTRAITCYLPLQPSVRQWSDRKRVVEAPLFPGYLFIQPEPDQIYALNSVRGSCGIISFMGRPGTISNSEVDCIKLMLSNTSTLMVHRSILVGERVEIINGPLCGSYGQLIRIKNQNRFVINANLLGQSVSVEINREDVRSLN